MLVEDAGHYPFLEAPDVTNPAIAQFARQAARHGGSLSHA